MRRLLVAATAVLVSLCGLSAANAQAGRAVAVTACASPGNTPVAGTDYPITMDLLGRQCVMGSGSTTVVGSASNASSGVATSSTNVPNVSYNYGWNGTTWDQLKTAPAIATTGVGLQGVGLAAVYTTTLPTYTDGQYGTLRMQTDGSLRASMITTAFTASRTGSTNNIGFALQGNSTAAASILAIAPMLWNGTTSDAAVSLGGNSQPTPTGVAAMAIVPHGIANGAIAASVSASSAATALVAKASAGNYYDAYCQSTAAGRCIVYNATAAPGAGALTAALVLDCAVVAAGGQGSIQYGDIPRRASTGITVLFSSSADCNTYTASSTAYIHASVQ